MALRQRPPCVGRVPGCSCSCGRGRAVPVASGRCRRPSLGVDSSPGVHCSGVRPRVRPRLGGGSGERLLLRGVLGRIHLWWVLAPGAERPQPQPQQATAAAGSRQPKRTAMHASRQLRSDDAGMPAPCSMPHSPEHITWLLLGCRRAPVRSLRPTPDTCGVLPGHRRRLRHGGRRTLSSCLHRSPPADGLLRGRAARGVVHPGHRVRGARRARQVPNGCRLVAME
jgi:hypothetical protein